jgi:hypothetical protein
MMGSEAIIITGTWVSGKLMMEKCGVSRKERIVKPHDEKRDMRSTTGV